MTNGRDGDERPLQRFRLGKDREMADSSPCKAIFASTGDSTPPTMLQNIMVGATRKRVGWHAEHNVHLLMIDLHAADECSNDLTPGRPVGRFQAGGHARGEIFEASNHQSQFPL